MAFPLLKVSRPIIARGPAAFPATVPASPPGLGLPATGPAIYFLAYGWQQREASENGERLVEVGRQLFERLVSFAGHLEAMRKGLLRAVKAYNDAVGSWQAPLLPRARWPKDLGAAPPQRELRELSYVALLWREPGRATAAED